MARWGIEPPASLTTALRLRLRGLATPVKSTLVLRREAKATLRILHVELAGTALVGLTDSERYFITSFSMEFANEGESPLRFSRRMP